jgi:hypothetical protein
MGKKSQYLQVPFTHVLTSIEALFSDGTETIRSYPPLAFVSGGTAEQSLAASKLQWFDQGVSCYFIISVSSEKKFLH